MEGQNPISESFNRMSFTLDQNSKVLQSSMDVLKDMSSLTPGRSQSEIHRPDKVEVEIKCAFLKIVDIHTVGQIFHADVFVQARWEEPAFAGHGSKRSLRFDPCIHWDPKLIILNADHLSLDRKTYSVRHSRSRKHPVVTLLWRFKGTFREKMELRHFPFDVQDLTIQVSTERPSSSVQLLEDPHSLSTVNTHTFDDAQEWNIYKHVECFHDRTTMEHASPSVHPILHFQSRVKRKVGYFMWNIVLIMALITGLTFTAVSIEPSNGDRIAVSIMLFLTAVAFKLVVKQDLPTISYLTYLDTYILVLVIFLTVQSTENACMCALGRTMTIMELRYWDRWIQIGLAVFLLVFHLLFLMYIQFTAMRRRRIMTEKDRQYESKRHYIEKHGIRPGGGHSQTAIKQRSKHNP